MKYHLVVLHWQSYVIFPGHPQILLLFWGATYGTKTLPSTHGTKTLGQKFRMHYFQAEPNSEHASWNLRKNLYFQSLSSAYAPHFCAQSCRRIPPLFHGQRLLHPEVQYSTWKLATISFLFWHLDCQIPPPHYTLVWAFRLSTGATEGIKQQGSTSKEFLQGIQTSRKLQKINLREEEKKARKKITEAAVLVPSK